MGWFGKKNKVQQDYTDVESANESLPMAVAVPVAAETVVALPPRPSTPPASQDARKAAAPMMVLPAAGPPKVVAPTPSIHSRDPIPLMPCPCCGQKARTQVKTAPNFVTWALVVLVLFLFWPLFFLPLVMNSTRRSEHTCSKCNAQIAVIHPLEDCCVKRR